jgi:hypothetical protein
MRRILFFCGFLMMLTACAGDESGPAAYTQPPSKGGKLCAEQCNKSRNYCGWSCDLDYRACFIDVQATAMQQYEQYANARLAGGEAVDKSSRDFEHPAACDADKKSCQADCDAPYNACYSSCGGTVAVP